MIGTSLGFSLALVEFQRWLFNYLDNLITMNCIGEGMQKGKTEGGNLCHFQSNLHPVEAYHL